MLEELFNLVKEHAADTVINNPDVPNEHNDDIVAEATNTVASGLRNVVAGGGAESVMNLFGNKKDSDNSSGGGIGDLLRNPIVAMMVGHFVSKLMSKYKMGSTQANKVATGLIPGVIGSLINKNNSGGSNGFSLDGLLNSITGGQANTGGGGGLGQILGQLTGGGQSQDQGNSGGGGLMDMITKMAGGAQQQQQKNSGGGLMDLIKGFMK